jgi:hypothetical protein
MTTNKAYESLVKQYIELRERKSRLTKQYEEKKARIDTEMDEISQTLMAQLNETGATSIKTPAGMFIKQKKTRYWAADWPAMHDFIRDNGLSEFYEKRLNQREVRTFVEENPDTPVPGLNADASFTLTVRRS